MESAIITSLLVVALVAATCAGGYNYGSQMKYGNQMPAGGRWWPRARFHLEEGSDKTETSDSTPKTGATDKPAGGQWWERARYMQRPAGENVCVVFQCACSKHFDWCTFSVASL